MICDDKPEPEVTGWADMPPEFGSALPYGSCNAILDDWQVCGWPRRADGACLKGHRLPMAKRA